MQVPVLQQVLRCAKDDKILASGSGWFQELRLRMVTVAAKRLPPVTSSRMMA